MKYYILTALLLVNILTINAQTPFDAYAPEHRDKVIIELQNDESFRVENADTESKARYAEFDSETLCINILDSANNIIAIVVLEPDDKKFMTIDPLSDKYPSTSPYAYCNNNPVMFVDPDGREWYKATEGEIIWTDYKTQAGLDANNIQGKHLGEAYVQFDGSRNERLGIQNGKHGYIDGDGAINASVTVYGPGGAEDIHKMTGYTMTSDAEKFGAIDEGQYNGNYYHRGKSGNLGSHWLLNNGGKIRMMDGKINPYAPSQISSNGEGYKTEIFIHSTNSKGFAGFGKDWAVSAGCLLISPKDWDNFNKIMSGVNKFTVQVNRVKP